MTYFIKNNRYFWGNLNVIESSDSKEYKEIPEKMQLVAKAHCKHRTVYVPKRDRNKPLPEGIKLLNDGWMHFVCDRCADDENSSSLDEEDQED